MPNQVANNGGMAILTLSANANHTDNENRTPLHIAAAADNAAAVSALLETGTVDINARDIAGYRRLDAFAFCGGHRNNGGGRFADNRRHISQCPHR